jgi:uncharacterized protein YdeI (YjbR/CyaY-like superfamily)
MSVHDDAPHFHPEMRAEWRAWLEANHQSPSGVWLVQWKSHTGKARVSYDDLVEEALCFGWIDSTARPMDADRSLLWFARRKRGSGWAKTNKERVARLESAGLIEEPGRRAIDAAKADGSWTLLDDVEDLKVPDDLSAAFAAHPGSFEQWERFPPSARKMALAWIVLAKRPETRAARVAEVARKSQAGERPR